LTPSKRKPRRAGKTDGSSTNSAEPSPYARLPAGLGDADLKPAAKTKILAHCDAAIEYGGGDAFGLTVEIKDMPLIGPVGAFQDPGRESQVLPRAHSLSNDKKYLSAAVRATNFTLGVNPSNQAFTTGVGFNPARAPLHMDSRRTGQPAPTGITVYGPHYTDLLPGFANASEWVHIWHLTNHTVPPSRTWLTTESYTDLYLWPMINEFTIEQTMRPTSYWWAYLAAHGSK